MTTDNLSTESKFDMAAWRRKFGEKLTQAEVADFLEIHHQTVSEIERGKLAGRKLLRLACAAALLGVVDYDGYQIKFGRIERKRK